MKELLNGGLIHGDCLTVTGKTVADNLKEVPLLSHINQVSKHAVLLFLLVLMNSYFVRMFFVPCPNPSFPLDGIY